jgi:hypothetical protein
LRGRAQFVDVADGIGLSIGSANLTAVHVGRAAVSRTAVLTRFPHRPSEVGVPSENPNLTERGLILTDFVDRVGDPVAIVAPDGSSHRAEVVTADALAALFRTLAGGRPSGEPVGVAYPTHWRPAAVEALRGALAAVADFRSPAPALLVSDATAALTALQQEPGVPARGVIAVCDFGSAGTSITLADAARGFAPIGPTVRHLELSGDMIDQALLTHVISDLSAAGSVDLSETSSIGSLTRLRAQCRGAKERLSTASVTSLSTESPGSGGEVRVTRNELDDAVRAPLADFVADLHDTLRRSGIGPNDLVAVASVGGGARIPIITTTLSEHLRVPVITVAQPELASAIGAGLKAAGELAPDGATSLAPAVGAAAAAAGVAALVPDPSGPPQSSTFRALAWSDADDVPEVAPAQDYGDGGYGYGYEEAARPQLAFEEPPPSHADVAAPVPWYRRSAAIVGFALFAVFAAIAAVVLFVFRSDDSTEPTGNTPSASTTPATTAPSPPSAAPPPSDAPPPAAPPTQTVTRPVEPPVVTATQAPPAEPSPTEPPPPPPPSEPPPPASEPPPSEAPPSSNPPPLIPTLPYQTIPGLPFVPAPIQPPPP